MTRCFLATLLLLLAGLTSAQAEWRASSPDEQALDAAAFGGLAPMITEQFGDVDSVVLVHKGRVAFEFYRDGAPDKLRKVHSVTKSALASVREATRQQNKGGPPVSMPYGYLWWVVPSQAPRPTFMASGYGGQVIWVYPPLELVVAITSAASPDSARRGQAIQLLRGRLFNAARQRASSGP